MKTEMRIKSQERRPPDEGTYRRWGRKNAINKNRLSVYIRCGACAALLLLLAVSGYTGANSPQTSMTASPVVTKTVFPQAQEMTYEEIRAEHEQQRQREIELLDSVMDDLSADNGTKNHALEQKTQIAARMETEAQVRAALLHMGYTDAAAVCGAQQVTVILAQESIKTDEDSVRVIDAAAAVAGIDPQNIRIILAKK